MYATPRAYEIEATAPTPSGAVRTRSIRTKTWPPMTPLPADAPSLRPERRTSRIGPRLGGANMRVRPIATISMHEQEQRDAVPGRDGEADPDDAAAERHHHGGEAEPDDRGGGPAEGRPHVALVVEERRGA